MLPSWPLMAMTALHSFLTTFPYAYHLTNLNIPELQFKQFINDSFYVHYQEVLSDESVESLWVFVRNIVNAGGLFGCLGSLYLVDHVNLSKSICMYSTEIILLASVTMGFMRYAESFQIVMAGRFIVGLSAGFSSVVLPVFLLECTPVKHRSFIGSFVGIAHLVNFLIGTVAGMPEVFGTTDLFPLLLCLPIIPALFQMPLYFWFPESPKRLLLRTGDVIGSEDSIRYYYGNDATDIELIQNSFRHEDKLLPGCFSTRHFASQPSLRLPLAVSVVVAATSQGTGFLPLLSQLPAMVSSVILSRPKDVVPAALSVGILVIVLAAGIVGMFLIEYWGKKLVLVVGYSGCVISLIGMSVFPLINSSIGPLLELICMTLFLMSVAIGPLLVAFYLPAELLPFKARVLGTGIAMSGMWLVALFVNQIFLPMARALSSFKYIFFAGTSLGAAIFVQLKYTDQFDAGLEERYYYFS